MNNYCRLQTRYDKKLKSRITTLKICDKLYKKLKSNDYDYEKIFYEQDNYAVSPICPYCHNNLINFEDNIW